MGLLKPTQEILTAHIRLQATHDVGIEIDCKLDVLQGRLEGPDGLTEEEFSLKDKLVVKYFETKPLSAHKKLKQKRD